MQSAKDEYTAFILTVARDGGREGMKQWDTLQYLNPKKDNPAEPRNCPVCNGVFIWAFGYAWQVQYKGQEGVSMAYFCSPKCILECIPVEMCWRT